MTGFGWAMTVLGARQVGNLLLADTERSAAPLDALSDAARAQLGAGLGKVLATTEALQGEVVDRLFGLPPADPVALSLAVLGSSAEVLKTFPGQRLAGQELANKLFAFGDFQYVESRLGLGSDRPLSMRIERASALGPYPGLWALEGLGFAHAESAWRTAAPSQALLAATSYPPHATVPLHTGMGISIAMRTLGEIDTRGSERVLRGAVEEHLALCETHAAEGCTRMSFEALGLVVRHLHPHLLQPVDHLLRAIDEELVGYFWHGVGRALYFLPSHVLPASDAWGRALVKARSEPRHALGRANALAGFAWALALVNVRHPEILERFLARQRTSADDERRAVANGVSSALVVWHGVNGRESILERLLVHRPEPAQMATWEELVSEPVTAAFERAPARGLDEPLEMLFRTPFPVGAHVRPGGAGRGELPGSVLVRSMDGWVGRALQSLRRTKPEPSINGASSRR